MATAFPLHQERRSTSPGGPSGGTRHRRTRGERNRRSGQRETLMKELDRERMLRADAEQRLKDMTFESESTKQRLVGLQNEFKKMEEMVRSMVSYKHKIDALKQEKSNLITSYEASVAKYQTHVKNLDRENRMLVSEMKKLESQSSSPQLSNEDLSYRVTKAPASRSSEEAESKTKVLLERLKMLEAENSSLVLENETQRQQYEKCLDSIANQVVQALLTQKGLREECGKLQKRVVDLEHQNRHLNAMFQQRIRFASDSVLQSALSKAGVGKMANGSGSGECRSPGSSGGSYSSLNLQQQLLALNEMTGDGRPGGEQAASACSYDSIFSLHSMCSDYNDHSQCEDALGKPEMSSPPPWLRDKVNFHFSETTSSETSEPAPTHTTLLDDQCPDQTIPKTVIESSYEMETEFPANNSSPKMKHVLHERRVTSPTGSNPEVVSSLRACVKSLTETAMRVCGEGEGDSTKGSSSDRKDFSKAQPVKDRLQPQSPQREAAKKSAIKLVRCRTCEQRPTTETAPCMACASENTLSPGQELMKLADSFNEKFVVNDQDGLPRIQNKLFDMSSEDDTSSRPASHTYSAASTVSLNELLERELDEMETPNDEGFSFDNLPSYSGCQIEELGLPGSSVESATAMANQEQEVFEDPVRDIDPDRSGSKLSKSSSQSESSILSQRPMRPADSCEAVLNNGCMSSECSPSLKRPTSLALSQEHLLETSDSESEAKSHQSIPTNNVSAPNSKKSFSPSKTKSKSTSQSDYSPKHYLQNLTKSKSAKNLSSKEPHPIKLYNVLSPPGVHEGVLEKFKKVPPKVKPKPSIAMCLKINSKEDQDDGPLKPSCKRPEVDGRESSPNEKKTIESELKSKKVKNTLTETVGVQESIDSVDPMTSSSSSGSPDSAMQQSFSSSSSDNTLSSDKPSCRDDGYLSNSTISMSSNDIPGEVINGQPIKRRPQGSHQSAAHMDVQQFRRRSQPQASSDAHCLDNTVLNPNDRKSKTNEAYADKCKSLPAGLKLGPVDGLHDSMESLGSVSSIENQPIGRVRDIKAFFEGKVEEKLRGRLATPDKAPEATLCVTATGARPRTMGRCIEQDSHQLTRSQSEDERSRRSQAHRAVPSVALEATNSWRSEDGLLGTRVPSPSSWHQQQQKPKDQQHKRLSDQKNIMMCPRGRKTRKPRLRRSWSDTTINRCMSDVRRDENKCLHLALRRDWARFCGALSEHARARSLPLNKDSASAQRKRSVSPRLLPRRSQRSQESIRLTGEGAESKLSPLGRPEAVGCASHQMAASYPSESSNDRHWGRHSRATSSDKNLFGWSSDSDTGEDGVSGVPTGLIREGPSLALPEWRQPPLQRQALGIRRLDRTAFSESNKPRLSSSRLIPPEGRPEAISPTASQGVTLNNFTKMVPPEKPPRRQMLPQDGQSQQGMVKDAKMHEHTGEGPRRTHVDSHRVSPQYQKEAFSSSLADFEREYSEMCQELNSLATNESSSVVQTVQKQGCPVSTSKIRSPVSETQPSDDQYQAPVLPNCSQIAEQDMSRSTENDAISDCVQEEDHVEGEQMLSTHYDREDELDEDEGRSSLTSSDSGPEFLTAEHSKEKRKHKDKQERAEMLDTLVTGGFSSSGGEDDVYMPHGGATSPTSPSAEVVADRLKDLPDGKQKVRVTTSFRQVVDRKTFVRYSEPEHHAIASFGFLEDLSPSASSSAQSQSEDEQRGSLRGHPSHKATTRQPQTSQQKQLSTRPQQSSSSAKQQQQAPVAKQKATSKQAQVNGKQQQPVKSAKAGTTATTRSVADGAASAKEQPQKGKLLIRSAESLRGRPANRTVLSLKDESRKDNRLSNSSFEGAALAGGDLSLSDSCCEDFADNDTNA